MTLCFENKIKKIGIKQKGIKMKLACWNVAVACAKNLTV